MLVYYFPTLAKNLISCSWGDLSVFPLAAMASGLKKDAFF